MPKIIKNIERIILEQAAKIFSKKGYEGSEMKAIAAASEIAVGTLYNYYPNKKMLYKDVFLKSWNQTIKKLKQVDNYENKTEQLRKQIEILYSEIVKRNGIGIDFKTLCNSSEDDFGNVAKEIVDELINVTLKRFQLKEEFVNSDGIYIKITIIWIRSQFELISNFPEDKETNLQAIYTIVSNFFRLK